MNQQYKIYLKDLNVVLERDGVIYRFIPTRNFEIQPEGDIIVIMGGGFSKTMTYDQIYDGDNNQLTTPQAVIDYLSPFVGFKNGGGTGNGGTYTEGKVNIFADLPQPASDYNPAVLAYQFFIAKVQESA